MHTHAHTHIQVARDNGVELAQRVGTRREQLGSLPREQGEGVCPLEAGCDQVNSVVPREVEGVSAVDGCAQSLGGYEDPGSSCGGEYPERECCPQGECPRVCGCECGPGVRGVNVCVHEHGKMRAATHA